MAATILLMMSGIRAVAALSMINVEQLMGMADRHHNVATTVRQTVVVVRNTQTTGMSGWVQMQQQD